jgi:hypothetical protein
MTDKLDLMDAWMERLRLRAEGDKLLSEGNKIRAEGDKLWAEGDLLWASAVIARYGNVEMEWKLRGNVNDCLLGNGDLYKGDAHGQ